MVRSRFLSAGIAGAALVASATSLLAQTPNRLGFTAGFGTSYTDRMGGNTIVGDALQHFDNRDYQDWALDPLDLTGSNFTLTGCTFVIQDQVGVTPETFDVVGYTEDPTTPNFPNPLAAWFRTGPATLPASVATGPVAWIYTFTFAPPAVPKGDIWVGQGLPQPAVGTWPTDGLSVHATFDFPPGNTGTNQLDDPGRGIASISNTNLACFIPTTGGVPTGPAVYPIGSAGNLRQIGIDLFANATGGVALSQTNQTRYVNSNPGFVNALVPGGGTTNMMSGSNPDTFNFNASATPRADNPGFLVTDVNFPGAPVFVLQAFGPSPVGSLPATFFGSIAGQPGTRGNVCIDFINASLSIGFLDGTGRMANVVPMNPALSAQIAALPPFDVWWQAFVVNVAASVAAPFELHATGCIVQHL
jgi:hypothetical protein